MKQIYPQSRCENEGFMFKFNTVNRESRLINKIYSFHGTTICGMKMMMRITINAKRFCLRARSEFSGASDIPFTQFIKFEGSSELFSCSLPETNVKLNSKI